METQNKWFRRVVAVALIASLIMNATIAVVFASWRDNVIIEQGKVIEQLRLANETLATGACYGYIANIRIDYAFRGRETSTESIELGAEQFGLCLEALVDLTRARLNQ